MGCSAVSLAAPSDRSLVTIALRAGIRRPPPPPPLSGGAIDLRSDFADASNLIVTRKPGALSSTLSCTPCSPATAATRERSSPFPSILALRSSR
jgi:hypothetical protein